MSRADATGLSALLLYPFGFAAVLIKAPLEPWVTLGTFWQLGSILLGVIAGFEGSFKWLYVLLLLPFTGYLWLLGQGH